MTEDIYDIRRDMSPRSEQPAGGKRQPTRKAPGSSRPASQRPPAPVAAPGSSEIAQRWVDAAEVRGYRVPFNANFLAHRVSARVARDKRMQELLRADREDLVVKWLNKMTDLFWKSYVQAGDTASNVADVFIDLVWDDLREYAYDSLRAIYLKEHGRKIAPAESLDHHDSELHKALEGVKMTRWVETNLDVELPYERRVLDETRRQMLASRRRKN